MTGLWPKLKNLTQRLASDISSSQVTSFFLECLISMAWILTLLVTLTLWSVAISIIAIAEGIFHIWATLMKSLGLTIRTLEVSPYMTRLKEVWNTSTTRIESSTKFITTIQISKGAMPLGILILLVLVVVLLN